MWRWRSSHSLLPGTQSTMNRNTLYLLVGALIVVVIGLGVYVYNEQTKPKGVEIQVDKSGISIQEN
ncbi:RsiW-degrading membrane proteinase PrsW (M82 family) [Kaistia defluvii]|uniref:RsiW-degrading membrane proteinase PrsW (M82 family) n=1 Tax=Kaistia defluvii TaxID=410841 RepID=A0ABV2QV15_9HYPH